MKKILLLALLIITLPACDRKMGLRAVYAAYPDCEIVPDWDSQYDYFVRKPDGSIIHVSSEGNYSSFEDNTKNLPKGETLIFKANK